MGREDRELPPMFRKVRRGARAYRAGGKEVKPNPVRLRVCRDESEISFPHRVTYVRGAKEVNTKDLESLRAHLDTIEDMNT